jgi:hypothetical protein
MIAQLIIPYCHYYKGESFPPERLKGEYSEMLWEAERMICEHLQDLVKEDNPRKSLDNAVAAYVSKWTPYKYVSVLEEYFANDNTYQEDVMRIYS